MKENNNGNDTNVGSIENSIEEAIERLEYIDRTYSCNNYYSIWDLKCIEILLSDHKRVLKENEEIKIKNNTIKRESEAYAEYMIRLDNELNLEKEKSKYEWIRQNCLSQELVNKLYIPIKVNKVYDILDNFKDELIREKMKKYLLKENKMCDFFESEE